MGVTYLAVDNVLRRKVALKVINVPAATRTSHPVREPLGLDCSVDWPVRGTNESTGD